MRDSKDFDEQVKHHGPQHAPTLSKLFGQRPEHLRVREAEKLQLVKASPREVPSRTLDLNVSEIYSKARAKHLESRFTRHSQLLLLNDRPRFLREQGNDPQLEQILDELDVWEEKAVPKSKDTIGYMVTVNPEKHHDIELLQTKVNKFLRGKREAVIPIHLYSYEFGEHGDHPHAHILCIIDKSNKLSEFARFLKSAKSTFSSLCNTECSTFLEVDAIVPGRSLDNRISYITTTKHNDALIRSELNLENFYSNDIKWFIQEEEQPISEEVESQEDEEETSQQESNPSSEEQ